jgi:hypothetical protein
MSNSLKVAAVFAIVCFVIATPAQAQGKNCMDFRAILQATLDVTEGTGVGWAGTVRGFLDNKIPIFGFLTGTGDLPTVQHGQTGHEPASRMIFDFPGKGRFVTLADKGVFPVSPQITPHMVYPPDLMFGSYFYTGKVAPDSTLHSSGWFEQATGDIHFNGTFLVDGFSIPNAPPSPNLTNIGAWNSEITGRLCNVNVQ